MHAYELGETCTNKRPYSILLVKLSRMVLFISITITTLTVALHLNADRARGGGGESSASWWVTFTPLWIGDGLAIILMVCSIFSPVSYMKRLLRTGEPRVGEHPSITELIPILLASVGKAVLLICFLVGQILIVDKIEGATEIMPEPNVDFNNPPLQRTAAVCFIPFYLLYVMYFTVAICIVNWSREILGFGIPLLAFFIMLSLRVDNVIPNLSWWAIISPLMIITIAMAVLLGYFTYYRWHIYDAKHRFVVYVVFAAIVCCYLFEIFVSIVLEQDGPDSIIALGEKPVLLVLPLFLAELMFLIPLTLILFGDEAQWGMPRTSQDLWEIPIAPKESGKDKLLQTHHYRLVRE